MLCMTRGRSGVQPPEAGGFLKLTPNTCMIILAIDTFVAVTHCHNTPSIVEVVYHVLWVQFLQCVSMVRARCSVGSLCGSVNSKENSFTDQSIFWMSELDQNIPAVTGAKLLHQLYSYTVANVSNNCVTQMDVVKWYNLQVWVTIRLCCHIELLEYCPEKIAMWLEYDMLNSVFHQCGVHVSCWYRLLDNAMSYGP